MHFKKKKKNQPKAALLFEHEKQKKTSLDIILCVFSTIPHGQDYALVTSYGFTISNISLQHTEHWNYTTFRSFKTQPHIF